MTNLTITNASLSGGNGADLASLVAARLCHDLVSPLGAIGNGVELLEMSGDFPGIGTSPELMLISESISAARARVRFYRAAFGYAPADQRIGLGEIEHLAQDFASGSRMVIEFDGTGDLSRHEARMLLLAIMCFDSAMPWGGRLLICRTDIGWRVVGEATRIRSERDLWNWLSASNSGRPMPAPSEVHFPLLAALSEAASRPIKWEMDETGAEISF